MHLGNWWDGTWFTTFIVGARYVTVLHRNAGADEIFAQVLELVGKDKLPFVILNSIQCDGYHDTLVNEELAEIVIGL